MPVHHSANWLNIVSISSPVGTQIPQAAGVAMGARISKKDDCALVYFGEGTASTGQFHVGLNFAGVFKAPCIFFCRNNGWAISTPGSKQTAREVDRHQGARLRHAGHPRRRQRPARGHRGDAGRGRRARAPARARR